MGVLPITHVLRRAFPMGVVVLLLASGSVHAAATITRLDFSVSVSDSGLTDDCRPGIMGTILGTELDTGQVIETSQGYSFELTTQESSTISWSDGTYSLITAANHYSGHGGAGIEVFTNTHVDTGDTYSLSGQFLYQLTFRLAEHYTIVDGVVEVTFLRSHTHSFSGAPETCP